MIGKCLLFITLFTAAANAAEVRKPGIDEIFGFLLTDLDTKDLLYICDFFKNHQYACNVTQLGVPSLKNHQSPPKKGIEKTQKIVLTNVTGRWSDSDGFMKSSYVKLDYLDIVAKCFFRTTYYECFGVPRCDDSSGFSPCSGGEPWRGAFKGAPNIGFTGNITAEAQMGSATGPDAEDTSPQNSTDTSAQTPDEYDKSEPGTTAAARSTSRSPSFISLELDGDTLPSEANTTIDGKPVYIKKFSNVDNETGMTSEGMVAVMPGAVISHSRARFNKTDGKNRVGGSLSTFSQSSVSSGGKASATSGNGFSAGGFEAGDPFGQSPDFGSGETERAGSRPNFFSSIFPSNFFGSLFDADDFDPKPTRGTRRPIRPVVSTPITADNASDPYDAGIVRSLPTLRSIIMNFQDMITSSILNSFQSFPLFNSRLQQTQRMQPMQQMQQMTPIAQSQLNLDNFFPQLGLHAVGRPASPRREQPLLGNEDDEFRKK